MTLSLSKSFFFNDNILIIDMSYQYFQQPCSLCSLFIPPRWYHLQVLASQVPQPKLSTWLENLTRCYPAGFIVPTPPLGLGEVLLVFLSHTRYSHFTLHGCYPPAGHHCPLLEKPIKHLTTLVSCLFFFCHTCLGSRPLPNRMFFLHIV